MDRKYTVKEIGDGKYQVTEHNPEPKKEIKPIARPKPLITIEDLPLIEEIQNKIKSNITPVPKPEPIQQKQKPNTVKEFQDLVDHGTRLASGHENRPIKIPKSIFDAFDY